MVGSNPHQYFMLIKKRIKKHNFIPFKNGESNVFGFMNYDYVLANDMVRLLYDYDTTEINVSDILGTRNC